MSIKQQSLQGKICLDFFPQHVHNNNKNNNNNNKIEIDK